MPCIWCVLHFMTLSAQYLAVLAESGSRVCIAQNTRAPECLDAG